MEPFEGGCGIEHNCAPSAQNVRILASFISLQLVMLGETFTGKTSLVLRFAEGYYRESSRNPTVGAFFITKRLTVQGMTAKIQIWDTAGQEQFKKLAPMYYKVRCLPKVFLNIERSIKILQI